MFSQEDLKERWRDLCIAYTNDVVLIDKRWESIKDAYTAKKRHYHNLDHLNNMFREFDTCFHLLDEFKAFQIAIFYHDIIYNVKRKDNEAKSAALAVEQLKEMSFPAGLIDKTNQMILATKDHELHKEQSVNLFVDVDMAIVGYDWEIYDEYAKNVRKEYSIYPDILYKKGRREVLKHFLAMESIFKTELFQNKYEARARENIQRELQSLT